MERVAYISKPVQDLEGLAEKFRAIGHPARVAILNLLCTCGCQKLTVKSIYETLSLDQPSASRHLNIMRKAGMLVRDQEGVNTYYRLCDRNLHVGCIRRCFDQKKLSGTMQLCE